MINVVYVFSDCEEITKTPEFRRGKKLADRYKVPINPYHVVYRGEVLKGMDTVGTDVCVDSRSIPEMVREIEEEYCNFNTIYKKIKKCYPRIGDIADLLYKLHYEYELSYSEISYATCYSEKAVRWQIDKHKEKLDGKAKKHVLESV